MPLHCFEDACFNLVHSMQAHPASQQPGVTAARTKRITLEASATYVIGQAPHGCPFGHVRIFRMARTQGVRRSSAYGFSLCGIATHAFTLAPILLPTVPLCLAGDRPSVLGSPDGRLLK